MMLMGLFTKDVGIDLGTANTLIYIKGKGIVLNEPSVIAMDSSTKRIVGVGNKAKDMLGKTPEHIKVIRPLQDGVISDFEMTASMLKEFISMSVNEVNAVTKMRVVVGVPAGVTEVEKRAVEEVIRQMGAKEVYILDEPLAAAIGVGLQVDDPQGCMIVDIGGGTSDIAIIALGGIVTGVSLRHAGDKLSEAVVQYVRRVHNVLIGEKTAEEIKNSVGCVYKDHLDFENRQIEVIGRDLLSGLPKAITVNSLDMVEALEEPALVIVDGIKTALERTPPEISSDISKSGIILSGGGALLGGLDKLIEKHTGMKTVVAENPLEAVAEGTGISISYIEKIHTHTKNRTNYR
ncbi:MAG: rod shape-determining protein [Anaerovorax sp.]